MTETKMPTRTDVRFNVVPVVFSEVGGYTIFDNLGTAKLTQQTREAARTVGDRFLADIGSADIIYTIRRTETERNASPEECTDDELRQAWQVWQEVQRLPMRHDEMGVADPFLNYPGDMEGYSDYFNEYAQEFTRRHEDDDEEL